MIWIPNREVIIILLYIKDQETFIFCHILQHDELRDINKWRVISWVDNDWNIQIMLPMLVHGGNPNSIFTTEVPLPDL